MIGKSTFIVVMSLFFTVLWLQDVSATPPGKNSCIQPTATPQWQDTAKQYKEAGLYAKAEPIYRMLLLRVCDDPVSTKKTSKILPLPSLEDILTLVDKGNYSYSRVMYLEDLKDIYIKQNRWDKAELCVRGKLRAMSTFYSADSPAIELVKKELQQVQEKLPKKVKSKK